MCGEYADLLHISHCFMAFYGTLILLLTCLVDRKGVFVYSKEKSGFSFEKRVVFR